MFEEHGYNIKEISVHRDGGKVFHLDNVDNGGHKWEVTLKNRIMRTGAELTLKFRKLD